MSLDHLPKITIRRGDLSDLPTRPPSRNAAFWAREEIVDAPGYTYHLYVATEEMTWQEVYPSSDGGATIGSGEAVLSLFSFTFSDSSPKALYTAVANEFVEEVKIYIDNAFNGTATLTVGFVGNTSRLVASTEVDMSSEGVYKIEPGYTFSGSSEVRIYFSFTGVSQGSGRILLSSKLPSS